MKKIVKISRMVLLSLLVVSLFSPLVAQAQGKHVHPSDLSLETLQQSDEESIYSMIYYEETLYPIVARSIGGTSETEEWSESGVSHVYKELSDEAKEATIVDWFLDPALGGSLHEQNTILTTEDTQEAMAHIESQLVDYKSSHSDRHLDVQVVAAYSGSMDIMPSYIFVGYRALDDQGVPYAISGMDTSHELIGDSFTGGSEYQYVAVGNGTIGSSFDYSTGELSDSPNSEGFAMDFNPVDYFGDETTVMNDEAGTVYTEEDLPPGSSPAFLEHGEGGVNSMEVGIAQANGDNTNLSGGSIFAMLMPILILGAVMLIALDN